MSWLSKKLFYAKEILLSLQLIKNWWLIFPLGLGLLDLVVVKVKNGPKLILRNLYDLIIIKEIWLDHVYPQKLLAKKTSSNPPVVIDVGAHIGIFSLFAAHLLPKARIHSLEPNPDNFQLLQANLHLNTTTKPHPHQLALWKKKGKLRLHQSTSNFGMTSLFQSQNAGSVSVNALSLAEFFKQQKIKHCHFLKLDCEGAEFDILFSTSKSVLKKISTIVLEYHNHYTKHSSPDLINFLTDLGFRVSTAPHPVEPDIGYIYAVRQPKS